MRIGKRVCKTYNILSNRERHENLNVLYVIDPNDEVKRAYENLNVLYVIDPNDEVKRA